MIEAKIEIDGRPIGAAYPPYVIAELSANHNGDIDRAISILKAAKSAGADAVKLQTYTADTLTIDHDGPDFQLKEGLWAGNNLYSLYESAHTPWEWHASLFEKGRELGITIFSTPFDQTSVDFLEQFKPPAYKIASFELVDLPLIEYVASKGKPLIISTGMADREEIISAVRAARKNNFRGLCLLHCTSGYPTPFNEADLRTIPALAEIPDVVPGLSDHTIGITIPVAAVALGACVIEKHLTLNRSDGGLDASFSIEPLELEQLVKNVRVAHESLGQIREKPRPSESTQRLLRRSLYAVLNIKAGDILTESNIRSIRPGFGLPPRELPIILGRTAQTNISRGTPISWDHIAPKDSHS